MGVRYTGITVRNVYLMKLRLDQRESVFAEAESVL